MAKLDFFVLIIFLKNAHFLEVGAKSTLTEELEEQQLVIKSVSGDQTGVNVQEDLIMKALKRLRDGEKLFYLINNF